MLFVTYARLDVEDGACVAVGAEGVRTVIPLGGVVCLLLERGTTVTHAAATLAARAGTLLVWVGEGAVRLYSAGRPGGERADKLLWQAQIALDDSARLRVVRRIYACASARPPRRTFCTGGRFPQETSFGQAELLR